jgi:hypothetical protein
MRTRSSTGRWPSASPIEARPACAPTCNRTFAVEQDVECRFGVPVAAAECAAVEWWASWEEDGQPVTMAGVSLVRFDENSLVADQRDYWNQEHCRESPYPGW